MWAFHEACLQQRGRESAAREAVTGLSASSLMDIQQLNNTCTGIIYPCLPSYSILLLTLHHAPHLFSDFSGLQTSFKHYRSKTLLCSMSKNPVGLQRAIVKCFEAICTYLCMFLYSAETQHVLTACNCSATVGTCHGCVCQAGFAPLGYFRLQFPLGWHLHAGSIGPEQIATTI